MKKLIALPVLATILAGCFGYTTTRTFDADGNKDGCEVHVAKVGNMIIGYGENFVSNSKRGERDCREWLKK